MESWKLQRLKPAGYLIALSLFVVFLFLILGFPRPAQVSQTNPGNLHPTFGIGDKAITHIPSLDEPKSAAGPEVKAAKKAQVLESYGKLPISFEVNRGQTDHQVKFLSRGKGYTLFLTSTEAVMVLSRGRAGMQTPLSLITPKQIKPPEPTGPSVVRMQLLGSNPEPQVTGIKELPGKSNYINGNDPQKWHANVSNYAEVKFQNVYPGVDLIYHGSQQQLEYDLVVAAGADPTLIKLVFQGAEKIKIDNAGDLVLQTNGSELRLHKPEVYQETNGIKHTIAAHFVLQESGNGKPKAEARTAVAVLVGIEVAAYDVRKPLIIDPVLSYIYYTRPYQVYYNYGSDTSYGIAVDGSGNAYVTGLTYSRYPYGSCCPFGTDFLTTDGAFQTTYGGGGDAFVFKLDPLGHLVYSTYLGGDHYDTGSHIAADDQGNAYVIGTTSSTNFPTVNPLQATPSGAFLAKLNASGSALVYSTYLGGAPSGIAADASGNAYVTGSDTTSKISTLGSLIYSAGVGGNSIAADASGNAYVAGGATTSKLSSSGSLIYSANVGGNSISVDDSGSVYVASFGSVSKLNPLGSVIYSASYPIIPGSNSIAVDRSGNTYVTGSSNSSNIPRPYVDPCTIPGYPSRDAFVANYNPMGGLVYSTYLGVRGIFADVCYGYGFGYGIAVDSSGNAYVTGITGNEYDRQDVFAGRIITNPSADSLTPVNISTPPSAPQSFTAIYADPGGYLNISDASLSLSGITHNEALHYNPATDRFTLQGAGGDCSPGQEATLSDGNLTLNCSTSSASGSGTFLIVTYNLTPQPSLSGTAYQLTISMVDQDGASNSKTPGSWIINRPPSADSVSPINSSTAPGTVQIFTAVYSDPDGWQNIAAANFYLSGNGGAHNEWLHYLVAPNLFTMMGLNDVCSPGQATTISNGFLTLDCGASSISGSGTVLTVTYRVTPQPSSSGIQYNIFSAASDQAAAAYAIFTGTWGIQ